MRRTIRTWSLLVGLATVLAFAPQPSLAGAGAALHPDVASFVDAGGAGTLDVIVAFHDDAGLDRLAGLGVDFDAVTSVPMANALLSAPQVAEVASWAQTRSVYPNAMLDLYLDESVAMIGAPRAWTGDGLRAPYNGAGVGVAVIDTGADATHPDLPYGAKVKKNFYVGGNAAGRSPSTTVFAESLQTDTEHGHGTHVASTIAGTGAASGGRLQGVAPGADVYSFKAGAGGSVLTWWTIRSFDWVIHNGSQHDIRVVSNSWGGGNGENYDPNDPVNIITKASYDNGIVVVFAAGNAGGPNKLNRYAVSPYVVSVGAVDKSAAKAPFSSVGRPGGDLVRDADGLYRPTLSAPGVEIEAARSSAGVVMSTGTSAENPFYTVASGTSMATPHVSGVVAMMLQARPALTPADVIAILEGTATPLDAYEPWEVGAGLVDAHAAVKAAERGQTKFAPSTGGKTPQYLLREGSEFQGAVLPAGYSVKSVAPDAVDRVTVPVTAGAEALYAQIAWPHATDSVYLFLDDPTGKEVASSAALTDIGSVNFRTVVVTNPTPGDWTLRVEGRINAPVEYDGFWGLYDENVEKKKRTAGTTTTDASAYSGLLAPSADAVHDSRHHDFVVAPGATEVRVSLTWAGDLSDVDLYVYDPFGRPLGKSTNFIGEKPEVAVVTSDNMGGALASGTWRLEVRGYLNGPEPYEGEVRVTRVV